MSYTEQLERDTERTRLELANTIEELREHLTPGQVLDEVLDYASDGDVGDYLRNFKRQAINNPIPLGLMGASMAWLIAASTLGRSSDGRVKRKRVVRDTGDFAGRANAGVRDLAAGAQRTASDLAGSAQAAGSEMADNVRGAADDLRDRAAEMGTDATHRAAEVAQDARAAAARLGDRMRDAASTAGATFDSASSSIADGASRGTAALADVANEIGRNSQAASRALTDFAREQPLIVAAAGLVLGAIIGTLLPSTETEDRLIGESSDAAKEKLREMASEQYAKAKDIAVHTAEAALDQTKAAAASAGGDGERHESSEFGPGPGYPASGGDARSEQTVKTEDAGDHAGGA